MASWRFLTVSYWLAAILCTIPNGSGCLHAAEAPAGRAVPAGSAMETGGEDSQLILLNPLEKDGVSHLGAWRFESVSAEPAEGVEPKVGREALRFSGTVKTGIGKGDFALVGSVPGEVGHIGQWVHLAADSNVKDVGVQVYDAEGEALLGLKPADWTGWQWVEFAVKDGAFKQAYPQDGKNGAIDFPLKAVHFVWFSREAGDSSLVVDGLAARTTLPAAREPFQWRLLSPAWGEPGEPLYAQLLANNFSPHPLKLDLTYRVQRNPQLDDQALPDPVYGSDHAQGQPSWIEIEGERIDNPALTDSSTHSSFSSPYKANFYTEGFAFIDLGSVRKVTLLATDSGDANWYFKVDLAASLDGKTYTPVEGCQGMDWHKKWGFTRFPVEKPFDARYLRFRFHKDGEKQNVIRMPASIYVYDGAGDEKIALPDTGETVASASVPIEVPPRRFALVPLPPTKPLGPGAYSVGIEAVSSEGKRLLRSDYFVMPEGEVALRPESRFGMNSSDVTLAGVLKRLGVSWIRFENMKWAFYSPAPHEYAFDGSVKPWMVNHDDIFKRYKAAGFHVLPYIFQPPAWASSAPEGTQKNIGGYPPKENDDYGEAIYQAVARYGPRKHEPAALKTADKASGLGLIDVYELWNEPNLNAPDWGPFVGPLSQYFGVFRAGAEAAKRAAPGAVVSSCGFAGISLDVIDQMRTHRYPDGKTPADFAEILNVHYYSGRQDPETATDDPNASRGGKPRAGAPTFVEELADLADWRDDFMPGKPIWMTETGYDVGGPIGLGEREQAAKLPRVVMLCLANGIEKVFVYREKGSNAAMHAGAGMLRNDGSLRPVYFTYANLIRQLDGAPSGRVPRLRHQDPAVWMYLWERAGTPVLSAWSVGKDGKLDLNLGKCTVTDAFGARRETVVGPDFALTEFPVYITGFETIAPLRHLQEEARAREAKRQQTRQALKNAAVYLYDFGSRDERGTKMVGTARTFTGVMAEDIYDEAKGYGFTAPGGKDEVRKWVGSVLENDAVVLQETVSFQMKPEPGKYQLTAVAQPLKEAAALQVKATGSNEASFPLAAGDQSTLVAAEVELPAGGTLDVSVDGPARLHWLTLVEKVGSSP